jgi:hypothetical protein
MLSIQTSESIATLAKALSKAQKAMTTATKSSNNPYFKSKYADIVSINEAIMPALLDNGFSVLQPSVYKEGKRFIKTILLHESGEYISTEREIIVAEAKKDDPQAGIAAETYARRGSLQAFFNVGAEDDDGNTAANTTSTEKGSLQGKPKVSF